MIVPDINLLIYAYNSEAPLHAAACRWWEDLLSSDTRVSLPWVTTLGFLRLVTHRRVMLNPLPIPAALSIIKEWFEQDNVYELHPGSRHLEILSRLLREIGVAGDMTTDSHLAALAIEHQCELHSCDTDFGRFAGLRWRNPLKL